MRDNMLKINGSKIKEEFEEEELFHRSSSKDSKAPSEVEMSVFQK